LAKLQKLSEITKQSGRNVSNFQLELSSIKNFFVSLQRKSLLQDLKPMFQALGYIFQTLKHKLQSLEYKLFRIIEK
jgi:hypothetical protein